MIISFDSDRVCFYLRSFFYTSGAQHPPHEDECDAITEILIFHITNPNKPFDHRRLSEFELWPTSQKDCAPPFYAVKGFFNCFIKKIEKYGSVELKYYVNVPDFQNNRGQLDCCHEKEDHDYLSKWHFTPVRLFNLWIFLRGHLTQD
ncbi:hypothetical protein RF11_13992 [Thelohanellus kitauei]|uniref:Uncharacterized protein n=1 Tax=Thelohanellus kitauei TaxID=669202 RepID=A0A0C2I751_THEKT|nr:hypothetical protein RF11_13992 [Thelohanellus kitauei]